MNNLLVHTIFAVFVIGKMMGFNMMIRIEGGANIPSLRQAQKNFIEFGACEERCIEFVRKPNEKDEKDVHWKQLV